MNNRLNISRNFIETIVKSNGSFQKENYCLECGCDNSERFEFSSYCEACAEIEEEDVVKLAEVNR